MINPDAIINITRNGTTFTATKVDGSTITFTQQDNNTTYSAGTGISLSGTTFSLDVAGAKTALGLGSAAYTASTAYAAASHTHNYAGSSSAGGAAYQANKLGASTEMNYGWNGLNYYNISGTAGAAAKVNDTPTTAWWHIIKLNHANTAGYYTDLAIPFDHTSIYYKRVSSGTVSDGGWVKVLDALNYTEYTPTKTGSGASGTWGISISGNAATATKATQDGNGKTISSTYLPLAGGTMTGQIKKAGSSTSWISGRDTALVRIESYKAYNAGLSMKTTNGSWEIGVYTSDNLWFTYASDSNYNAGTGTVAQFRAASNGTIYGAVWNDYAEYRSQNEELKPGYITYCDDDGKLKLTTERLQKFEGVVSDTFGFAIGETDDCKTPLAVSGRVLVYCDPEDKFHSGDCVCAGPDGLAYRMTREEIVEFPDRIVGVVSEIPTYETWGTGNIEVNGRIWVKVR